ncbi:hypothetical protein [Mesorhizobium sp.]|uniref:hypothetical protein n=1 Tax=Mesorhizobium sp. TaxID=1871066 RepID=UPI000FE2CEEF|nr:hypothetical protein [Mesorhizobium sp.]RWH73427.1 MAG: hypothetical protein EOQ84_07390 [Mesorhizobium sp.]RWL25646.1 MAG: hypothetical protein EOR58_19610 [Mesorhizobium sp.]RWL36493.1 MAG: hypothetical protein EOR63_00665 [Mesorhizobium sp.]RWL40747.1 MAG: hypothetical protein EOR59_04620 [Mesorhizobium sp.]RWL54456.1 MAG: hypothetical protein EOR62_11905 [Mesorhizobium sp.]
MAVFFARVNAHAAWRNDSNLFASLMFIGILAVILFFSSQPLLPEHHKGKMVILLPPDAVITGSIKASTHSNLPAQVDGNLVQPRPSL